MISKSKNRSKFKYSIARNSKRLAPQHGEVYFIPILFPENNALRPRKKTVQVLYVKKARSVSLSFSRKKRYDIARVSLSLSFSPKKIRFGSIRFG